MPKININGTGINYFEIGRGPALLLISGLGGDSSNWIEDVQFYKKYFRCISIDNRGMGKSDPVYGEFTIKDMALDAATLLSALKIKKAHILGLSMGGAIAQEIAISYPELADKLIISSSWAKANLYTKAVIKSIKEMNQKYELETFLKMMLLWCYGRTFYNNHPKKVKEMEEYRLQNPFPKDTLNKQCIACLKHNTLSRLEKIKSKTLITAGDEDILTPKHYSQELANYIKRSNLIVFENLGHLHLWENPQIYRRTLLNFLLEEKNEKES